MDGTLTFLWKLAEDKERRLVEDLCIRNYYKRVFEIPLGSLSGESWVKLRETFRSRERLQFQEDISSKLTALLRTAIQDASKVRESITKDRALEEMEEIASSCHCFLVDLPTRGWAAGGDDPIFVSDYKRRYFRANAGGVEGFEMGSLWSRHLYDMMREIAFFRVFCEPRIHRILNRVLTAKEISNALLQIIPILKKRK